MDSYGALIHVDDYVECHLLFKLKSKGRWAQQMGAENGDLIRVIGTFSPENIFSLILDDNEEDEGAINKARMIILEPYILIPTTQIVKAFPCARSAFLSHQFKGMSSDVNYALVLGNVIHNVFQQILETMDFRKEKLNQMIT